MGLHALHSSVEKTTLNVDVQYVQVGKRLTVDSRAISA